MFIYKNLLLLTTGLLLICTIYLYKLKSESVQKLFIQHLNNEGVVNKHSFLTALDIFNRDVKYCDDLKKDWNTFKMSPTYMRLQPRYDEVQIKVESKFGEGYSASKLTQRAMLQHVASHPSVKTICETGFNYGHSSFNFLSANPNVHVYSFDLGVHDYVKHMNKTIHEFFPGNRHTLILGDSSKTVPEAIEKGVLPLCDVVFVDGGHVYNVARADIINFSTHVNQNNIILFDDYPTNWGVGFGKAWDEALLGWKLLNGEVLDVEQLKRQIRLRKFKYSDTRLDKLFKTFGIKELVRCQMKRFEGLQGGMTVGTVIQL